MAYLVNPAGECDVLASLGGVDYIGLGRKNLDALMVTENLLGRIEFGFAADRLGLGTLPYDINTTLGHDYIDNSDVWLYNFSTRVLAVKENSDDIKWLPAITFGADVKYNADIASINDKLSGALSSIGYAHNTSVDLPSRPPRPGHGVLWAAVDPHGRFAREPGGRPGLPGLQQYVRRQL